MSKNASLGYAGSYLDTITGGYPLGNGYRWYMPELMRFNAPDSLSPFGLGGINPYTYCAGDPINGSDPSGHTAEWMRATEDEAEEFLVNLERPRDVPIPVKRVIRASQEHIGGLPNAADKPGPSSSGVGQKRSYPLPEAASEVTSKQPRSSGTADVPAQPPEDGVVESGKRVGRGKGEAYMQQMITNSHKEATGDSAYLLKLEYRKREGRPAGNIGQLVEFAFLRRVSYSKIATHVSEMNGFTTLENLAKSLGLPGDHYDQVETEEFWIAKGVLEPRLQKAPQTGYLTVNALIRKHILPRLPS